jgi:hypothetical protein
MAYIPYTPIPIGSLLWGAPLNTAIQQLDAAQMTHPQDHSLTHWTFPPATNMVGTALTSGTVSMSKLWVRQPVTISVVGVGIATVGAALVVNQNFLGLYDAAGNRLGVTADQTASWATIGYKQAALGAPVPLTAGYYYVAILSNAGTTPAFARGSALTSSIANANLTATDGAYTTGPAAQTSLPVSITMASRTLAGNTPWVTMG